MNIMNTMKYFITNESGILQGHRARTQQFQ
jgi:hypothetical protein